MCDRKFYIFFKSHVLSYQLLIQFNKCNNLARVASHIDAAAQVLNASTNCKQIRSANLVY
jgi:hypothetical protein